MSPAPHAPPSTSPPLPRGERYDLVVLGGGIMGMACAFEEASRGRTVAVLDPNPLGHKASWAAAGILVARAGVVGSSPIRDFYLRSLLLYPRWLERISAAAGESILCDRTGDYQIFPAGDSKSYHALHSREGQLEREKARDFSVSESLPAFLDSHAGFKAARVFHFPNDAHINARALLAGLEKALRNLGVAVFSGCRTGAIDTAGGIALKGEGWNLRAGQMLIAAGAWCNEILNLLGWSATLTPVKGQVALLPNFHGQECMLHIMERFYLVPRGGNLVVGSTTESGVWDERFDEHGDTVLGGALRAYFPKVEPRWVETWTGLRPRTRDRNPIMGWLDPSRGIAICSGHYKSGVSQAPLVAQGMSALLNGEKTPGYLRPFDPRRKGALMPIPVRT